MTILDFNQPYWLNSPVCDTSTAVYTSVHGRRNLVTDTGCTHACTQLYTSTKFSNRIYTVSLISCSSKYFYFIFMTINESKRNASQFDTICT